MASIKHVAPDQRRHVRSRAPIGVRLRGLDCSVRDWGLGGLCVEGFAGDPVKPGDKLPAELTIDLLGLGSTFTTKSEVVWVARDGKTVAVRFVGISTREKEVLGRAVLGTAVNGERESLLRALNGLDSIESHRHEGPDLKATAEMDVLATTTAKALTAAKPLATVTPVSTLPTALESPPPDPRRQFLRRVWGSLLYWAAGLALGAVMVTVLYFHFFRLDLEYSVVSLPISSVVSQDLGRCEEVLVREGDAVRKGQALVVMDDDVLSRDLEIAELRLAAARADLTAAESRIGKEKEKLKLYERITRAKLASADALVSAYTIQLTAHSAILQREQTLVDSATGGAQAVNMTQARVAELEGLLLQARAEKLVAETAVDAIKQGSFYNSRELVGDLAAYQEKLDDAKERIQLTEQRVLQIRERVKRLTYRAPFDGKVVKVLKAAGSAASRGETLVIVERTGAFPVVDAYVTQAEANSLTQGGAAAVWLPSLDKTYRARVTKIDRTSGFQTEMQAHTKDSQLRYNWRGAQDRSASVQLVIDQELPPEAWAELAGGMPATVSVATRPSAWQKARTIWAKASPW